MPRIGRVILPNYPHHVVLRGHNRRVLFAEEANYQIEHRNPDRPRRSKLDDELK